MRQGCTSCVEYLPGRTFQAMNKNAKVKRHIHEAKLCICSAWFLVHLSSCRTREHCVGVGIMYVLVPSPCFSFLQKVVDNKYSRYAQTLFGFVVHIHALRKVQIQKIHIAWIPKCLPSFYFIVIFFLSRERFILKRFFLLFSIFFLFRKKLK